MFKVMGELGSFRSSQNHQVLKIYTLYTAGDPDPRRWNLTFPSLQLRKSSDDPWAENDVVGFRIQASSRKHGWESIHAVLRIRFIYEDRPY